MAEYAERDFAQFARDFYLYSTYFPFYLNERAPFEPCKFIEQAKTAVFEMSSVFNPFVKKYIFEKSADVVLRTDEDFLRFLVPKCLRIYTSRNYETLTVVMSLVHEFLLYLQMNRLCYRFHFTAYKCLVAVFRRLHGEQWAGETCTGFRLYLKRHLVKMRSYLSDRKTVDEETLRKNEFQTYMVNLFKKLEREGDEYYVLNQFERSLVDEDDPRSLVVNDPDEVDNDPFIIDLAPDPDFMEGKARRFDSFEFGIPISSLLPVPNHTKPTVFSSDGSDMSVGSRSPQNSQNGDRSPEDSENEERLPRNREIGDRLPRNNENRDRSPVDRENGERSPRNRENGDRLPRNNENRDRSPEDRGENEGRSPVNSENGDRSPEDSENGDHTPEDSETGNSDLSNHTCSEDREMANESFMDTFDEEYENSFETRTGFTKFELYTSAVMQDAARHYDATTLRDKLLKRDCEYCGIKCYQFSYNLYRRQLDSAIVRRSRN